MSDLGVYRRARAPAHQRDRSTSREIRERLPHHDLKGRSREILPQEIVGKWPEKADSMAIAVRRGSAIDEMPDLPLPDETMLQPQLDGSAPEITNKSAGVQTPSHASSEIFVDRSGTWLPADVILEAASKSAQSKQTTRRRSEVTQGQSKLVATGTSRSL